MRQIEWHVGFYERRQLGTQASDTTTTSIPDHPPYNHVNDHAGRPKSTRRNRKCAQYLLYHIFRILSSYFIHHNKLNQKEKCRYLNRHCSLSFSDHTISNVFWEGPDAQRMAWASFVRHVFYVASDKGSASPRLTTFSCVQGRQVTPLPVINRYFREVIKPYSFRNAFSRARCFSRARRRPKIRALISLIPRAISFAASLAASRSNCDVTSDIFPSLWVSKFGVWNRTFYYITIYSFCQVILLHNYIIYLIVVFFLCFIHPTLLFV
jgi:hypothetical protein